MKNYREGELNRLAIFYLIIIMLTSTNIFDDISLSSNEILISLFKDLITSIVVPLVVIIFDCVLTTDMKNRLLISKLYGYKVFKKIQDGKVKDERFDVKEAQNKYASIISNLSTDSKNKSYQNQQWNKIYKRHEDNGAVKQSQKDFLMLRDMYSQTLLFLIFYIVFCFAIKFLTFSPTFIIIDITMAIILNIATHNKAKRFVLTAIAKDL